MSHFDDLKGVVPALVTPLNRKRRIDEAALRRIVRRVIDGGSDGILALGSAGEGPLLIDTEREIVVKTAVDEAAGRVPIIAGVDSLGTEKAIEGVCKVAEYGAKYALVLPPFYMPITDQEIYAFYKVLSENVPIPVLVYNIPQLTSVQISLATIRKIAELDNVAGIKDSAGDMTWFQNMQNRCQSSDFKIFQGRTTLWYLSAVLGADGVIDPAINIIPQWDVALLKAVKRGDYIEARAIQNKLLQLAGAYSIQGYSVYPGVKTALSLLGLIDAYVAEPFDLLGDEYVAKIRSALLDLGILQS
jgi:4-hydroxy-tetrahydrodipicolinate synthase